MVEAFILTCLIFRKSASQIQVSIGDHDWTSSVDADSFRMAVSQIKMHPSYVGGSQLSNDAALLKLSSPINFGANPHVRPICLPLNSGNWYENQPAQVAGSEMKKGVSGMERLTKKGNQYLLLTVLVATEPKHCGVVNHESRHTILSCNNSLSQNSLFAYMDRMGKIWKWKLYFDNIA